MSLNMMCEGCVPFFSLSPAHPLRSIATLRFPFQALLRLKLRSHLPEPGLCSQSAPCDPCSVSPCGVPPLPSVQWAVMARLPACMPSGMVSAFASTLHAMPGPEGAVTLLG